MLVAIVIGIWAMIFMIAMIRGMVEGVVADGIRTLPGHVQIHHPDFLDDPTVDNLLPEPDESLLSELNGQGVAAWSSRVRVPAAISSERATRGITLVGIDPVTEGPISFLADDISEGNNLAGERDKGIILGKSLLERLDTDIGKRVAVMSQGPDNDVADRGFRIVGVFEAEIAATEEAFAFVGRSTLQDMLGIGNNVSEIAILAGDNQNIDSLVLQLTEVASEGAEILPWNELNHTLAEMVRTVDSFVIIWIAVIFLALSFGLVNTMVMAVFERVREIGLMMALGMKPRVILAQIVVEALILLTMGLAAGNCLAWITIYWLRDGMDFSFLSDGLQMFGYASVLTPLLQPGDVILSTAIVLVLGFLASLFPAIRAARYQPVEAISKD